MPKVKLDFAMVHSLRKLYPILDTGYQSFFSTDNLVLDGVNIGSKYVGKETLKMFMPYSDGGKLKGQCVLGVLGLHPCQTC